jgi:6-phospho-beta-glucosidase
MRVAIIGGSAPSTPQLLIDARLVAFPELRFVLHGRSPARLQAVRRAAVVLEPALRQRITVTTDLIDAVSGADLVVIQVRVGGLAARAHDERFPLEAGVPGDEGLGPGGLAAAWRSWPAIDAIAATIAEHAPAARVALLSAPLGILTRCVLDTYPGLDVVGLCELPAVVLNEIRATLRQPSGFTAEYAGVNHLGWFTSLGAHGADRLAHYAATRDASSYPDECTILAAGGVPLPYVRLHERGSEVVDEQRRAAAPRGAVLNELSARAYRAFADGGPAEIRAALARRPAPWYREAVAPWIEAPLIGLSATTFFLTTRNRGYLRGISADEVVEIPHRAVNGRFIAAPPPRLLPTGIARTLGALIDYEAEAARAVRARNPAAIAAALARHPWVPATPEAIALASSIVALPSVRALATGPA